METETVSTTVTTRAKITAIFRIGTMFEGFATPIAELKIKI